MLAHDFCLRWIGLESDPLEICRVVMNEAVWGSNLRHVHNWWSLAAIAGGVAALKRDSGTVSIKVILCQGLWGRISDF